MGFRFRKSIKLGPARINLSKSGVGYSVGGKGFRVTKKATGGTRATASIPGTGLSYAKETGKNSRSSDRKNGATISTGHSTGYEYNQQNVDNRPVTKRLWFWIVVVILAISVIGGVAGWWN